ncbi:hypothetical protein BaRGS_00017633 [Batillaria attramentaria]|uniref:Uncharacterized protein n=1 Tax=Batillaria attramentaria TaxID=370345 RepID=A0ABD0KVY6_9CAEN
MDGVSCTGKDSGHKNKEVKLAHGLPRFLRHDSVSQIGCCRTAGMIPTAIKLPLHPLGVRVVFLKLSDFSSAGVFLWESQAAKVVEEKAKESLEKGLSEQIVNSALVAANQAQAFV